MRFNFVRMVEKSNHRSIQLQNKSTGHPESDQLALDVKKQKKKSEPGGSLIKNLLDVT